jgi:hypothetical protein
MVNSLEQANGSTEMTKNEARNTISVNLVQPGWADWSRFWHQIPTFGSDSQIIVGMVNRRVRYRRAKTGRRKPKTVAGSRRIQTGPARARSSVIRKAGAKTLWLF